MRRIGASCFCELSPRTAWNVRVIAARLATLRGERIVLHSLWRAFPISGPLPPPYPATGTVACVDRRLAEAEFCPYIGLDYQYRNTVIRNKQVWSPANRRLVPSPAIPLIDRFGRVIGENTPLFVRVGKRRVST